MLSLVQTFSKVPTLEVYKHRDSHAIPLNDVEYLDSSYRPSPDVVYFVIHGEHIFICKQRQCSSCRACQGIQ